MIGNYGPKRYQSGWPTCIGVTRIRVDGIQMASGSLIREPEDFTDPPCSRCYRADGDYLCRACGRFICSGECSVVAGGKTYCVQCVPVEEEAA